MENEFGEVPVAAEDSDLPRGRSLGPIPISNGIVPNVLTDKRVGGVGSLIDISVEEKVLEARDSGMSAIKLAGHAHSLSEAERAVVDMATRGEFDAAGWFKEIAKRSALDVLDEAIKVIDNSTTENLSNFIEDVHNAERRLGLLIGTLESCFVPPNAEVRQQAATSLRQFLVNLREDLARSSVTGLPEQSSGVPRFVAPILRIASAILVGAAVGAPLAAFSVHEHILTEMAKAGIETGVGVAGVELINPLIAKLGTPPSITVGGSDGVGDLDELPPDELPPSIRAGHGNIEDDVLPETGSRDRGKRI